jgi:hypothetical protein
MTGDVAYFQSLFVDVRVTALYHLIIYTKTSYISFF